MWCYNSHHRQAGNRQHHKLCSHPLSPVGLPLLKPQWAARLNGADEAVARECRTPEGSVIGGTGRAELGEPLTYMALSQAMAVNTVGPSFATDKGRCLHKGPRHEQQLPLSLEQRNPVTGQSPEHIWEANRRACPGNYTKFTLSTSKKAAQRLSPWAHTPWVHTSAWVHLRTI